MKKDKDINFFATLEDAFNYQNAHSGALYINRRSSTTKVEYDIAAFIAEASESYQRQRRYIVATGAVQAIIERECFTLT